MIPAPSPEQVTTFAVHVTEWKRPFLQRYFPQRRFHFLPKDWASANWTVPGKRESSPRCAANSSSGGPELPLALAAIAKKRNLPVTFLEDGFLRSHRPSASRTPPLSLALDSRTPYFDCGKPVDLEMLLSSYDFEADPALMSRARAGIELLIANGICKYNGGRQRTAEAVYGEKTRKRVLVIGQVEDDASIRYGCPAPTTNNDLARLAAGEQPEAQILCKRHSDVLNPVRDRNENSVFTYRGKSTRIQLS